MYATCLFYDTEREVFSINVESLIHLLKIPTLYIPKIPCINLWPEYSNTMHHPQHTRIVKITHTKYIYILDCQ